MSQRGSRCKMCREVIIPGARKCRHCGALQRSKAGAGLTLVFGLLLALVGGAVASVCFNANPHPQLDWQYDLGGYAGCGAVLTGILMFFFGSSSFSKR